MTVAEYKAASRWGRFKYRFYRHPLVMFGIGPAYVFFLVNRLPFGAMKNGVKPWASALLTNLGVAVLYGVMIWAVGWKIFVLIQIPTVLVAASIGVWMFYVQHQFDETHWSRTGEWDREHAAPRILKAHPELKTVGRLTFVQSLKCVKLALWDEMNQRMVSFRAAKTP